MSRKSQIKYFESYYANKFEIFHETDGQRTGILCENSFIVTVIPVFKKEENAAI
jgi:hypothetical protein